MCVKCVKTHSFSCGIDYDPEDILEPMNDNNDRSDQESDNEESTARDHYLSVGKSKLRSEQPLLDDPRYAGKRTSRKDIYSDEDDDEEEDEEFKGFSASGSEDEDEDDEENVNDSNDDDEDLLANAGSEEDDDSDADSDEEEQEEAASDAESAQNEGDDEINTELRRIQEEEKYVYSHQRHVSILILLSLQTNDLSAIQERTVRRGKGPTCQTTIGKFLHACV